MTMGRQLSQFHIRGTTLLEVLIALMVLMIGFVAVAGLQSISLKNNHSAFLRAQATIQAHDMSDRMYANTTGVALDAVNCTPAQMATYDAWEWNTGNALLLPSGTGTVTGPDGNGLYVISVSWVEQQAGAAATKTFNFQVKPLP
jgi:type IV pilus assembly protein PilV